MLRIRGRNQDRGGGAQTARGAAAQKENTPAQKKKTDSSGNRRRHPVAIVGVVFLAGYFLKLKNEDEEVLAYEVKYVADAPDYQVELLDINEYSRPGTALTAVDGIVVHYAANPGTTAEQNRSYFQSLKDTGETYASSHFVIGIEGEIV